MQKVGVTRELQSTSAKYSFSVFFPSIPPSLLHSPLQAVDAPTRAESNGFQASGGFAQKNNPGSSQWKLDKFLSGPFTWGFLAVGQAAPFAEHLHKPMQMALRSGDSELVAVGITEALKRLTHVPRPDTGEPDSFPSGHATAAFAMATAESQFNPGSAIYWYLGATAISVSRVRLNRHHITDVLAGAAVGFLATRWELSQPRGLLLNGLILDRTSALGLAAAEWNQPAPMGWSLLTGPYGVGVKFSARF